MLHWTYSTRQLFNRVISSNWLQLINRVFRIVMVSQLFDLLIILKDLNNLHNIVLVHFILIHFVPHICNDLKYLTIFTFCLFALLSFYSDMKCRIFEYIKFTSSWFTWSLDIKNAPPVNC